jgi:signal transduction histidine kinase/tetratricopeptide (TPR) repeat protein
MIKTRLIGNIKLRKMLPRALIILVIASGLVISILGMYFVGQQKISREEELKKDFSVRLVEVAGGIENSIRKAIEQVFQKIEANSINTKDQNTLLETVKNIVLTHPIIQYPFIISSGGKFTFPFSGKPVAATLKTIDLQIPDRQIKSLYSRAQELEFKEQQYLEAITYYLKCLGEKPDLQIDPYIFNCIARCYFKLKKFSQALAYYTEILHYYPEITARDRSLYFQVLRQTALSYKQKQDIPNALKYYLKLYEEIPRYQILPDASTLVFFKNEALDYLNQHSSAHEPENRRFKRMKEIDRLEGASELDIALRWRYFDIEDYERDLGQDQNNKDQFRFLKLKELFAPSDRRARFYRNVKNMNDWEANQSSSLQIKTIRQPVTGIGDKIAFKKIAPTGHSEEIFWGFMVRSDFIRTSALSEFAERNPDKTNLEILILDQKNHIEKINQSSPLKSPLLSYDFKGPLAGQRLVMAAEDKNYFETRVQKEIRFIYILIISLMLTLILGTYFFYKYFSREAELVRLKSEFVDSASHSLKTPLTRIRMLAEKLQLGWVKAGAKREEYYQTIIRETDNLTDMIENMLDFSRIEAGKKTYEFQPESLGQQLRAAIDLYAGYLRSLDFHLEVDIDDTLPPMELAPKAIKLVVGNLVHNAVKYSPAKKWIGIRLYQDKNNAVIEICDRGSGIAAQDLAHIFEKFYRGRKRDNKSDEGSGLGLYLVKHAVTAHGGTIKVQSKPSAGSTFTICLPLTKQKT